MAYIMYDQAIDLRAPHPMNQSARMKEMLNLNQNSPTKQLELTVKITISYKLKMRKYL